MTTHSDPLVFVPRSFFEEWKMAHHIPAHRHPYARIRKDPKNGSKSTTYWLYDIQLPLGLSNCRPRYKLVYKSTESAHYFTEWAFPE